MRAGTVTGFTLMELLMALTVVGIIAVIAVPSYQQSLVRARRSDARLLLSDTAQRLERCYAECDSYVAAACASPCPGLPLTSSAGDYEIRAGNGSALQAQGYTLVATPVAGRTQARDGGCTSFTLDHREARTATGREATRCWQ